MLKVSEIDDNNIISANTNNIKLLCFDMWNFSDYKFGKYYYGELLWIFWKYLTCMLISKKFSNYNVIYTKPHGINYNNSPIVSIIL